MATVNSRRMLAIPSLPLAVLLLVLVAVACVVEAAEGFVVPQDLIEKAISNTPPDLLDQETAQAARAGDYTALFRLAKLVQQQPTDLSTTSRKIFHALADEAGHIPSQVALGMQYYNNNDSDKALQYFVDAGENGPHQASLYNAGRIYAEAIPVGPGPGLHSRRGPL